MVEKPRRNCNAPLCRDIARHYWITEMSKSLARGLIKANEKLVREILK